MNLFLKLVEHYVVTESLDENQCCRPCIKLASLLDCNLSALDD
jgi:hypothetical protein